MYSLIGWLYNIKKTDWDKFSQYVYEAQQLSDRGKISLVIDSLWSSLVYELAPNEYFLYSFFFKTKGERKKWVGTTSMWKAQRVFVPKSLKSKFADKDSFRAVFHSLMDYPEYTVTGDDKSLEAWLEKHQLLDVFIKPADGQCGQGASRMCATDPVKLTNTIKSNFSDGKYIIQPHLANHETL